jgi:membrane protein implicated in regulation of membrane protease activity
MVKRGTFCAVAMALVLAVAPAWATEKEQKSDEAAVEETSAGDEAKKADATEEAAPSDAGEEAAAPGSGSVSRSSFTRKVAEREPADEVTRLGNDATQISYFSEVRDMAGKTVIHRWEYDGQVMSEVAFDVEGPRWRVHSMKTLDPAMLGQWTVRVVDVEGNTMSEEHFTYEVADAVADAGNIAEDAAPPAAPAE